MNTMDIKVEELFWTHLAHLGNEAKRHLIEMLVSSLTFKNDNAKEDGILLKEINGAWEDGIDAEDTIKTIMEARTQGVTRRTLGL